MPVSPARAIAFDVLLRVETENAYASDLLHAQLDPLSARGGSTKVAPADAALATELTLGVLRWRRLLDFVLQRGLKKPIDKLDLAVAVSLRLGLYQLRFLQRIPARAAVSESVELVRRGRKSSAASLVNAVLRRCGENAAVPVADLLPGGVEPAERLGILHSHPTWLVERWLERFGDVRTLAILEANNRTPRLACVLTDDSERDEIIGELEKSGLRVEPARLLRSALAVKGGSAIATDAFRRGAISIQDEGSQCIPLLLDARPGDRVLDLCAAPGGKTAILARACGESGIVIAGDIHAHRIRAMRGQFERLRLPRIQSVQLDATKTLPLSARFDRILVDAPCSGTGTLARHPEIRWRLKPEQFAEFHRLQVAILASALEALAPGGRLVYSTCSLEPEENEDVIAEVIRNRGARLRVFAHSSTGLQRHLAPGVDAAPLFDSQGYFRTIFEAHPIDGFFAGVLENTSSP